MSLFFFAKQTTSAKRRMTLLLLLAFVISSHAAYKRYYQLHVTRRTTNLWYAQCTRDMELLRRSLILTAWSSREVAVDKNVYLTWWLECGKGW